jgi:hypothetical protein
MAMLGRGVGNIEGVSVGTGVTGSSVGLGVGVLVGAFVSPRFRGAADGSSDGVAVGLPEANTRGKSVGAKDDGESEGTEVVMMTAVPQMTLQSYEPPSGSAMWPTVYPRPRTRPSAR